MFDDNIYIYSRFPEEMKMKIRPYEEKDWADVRFVCLNSEGPCPYSEDTKHFILTTYCDYFIEKEGFNCFVATDDSDRAVGYVICTEDYDRYKKCFDEEYLTRFSDREKRRREEAYASSDIQRKYKEEYPAHLHIDVLPEYQRMGVGHRLVDTLCEHLRKKNIPGVMLTVGKNNSVGRGFYEKYGFTLLEVSGDDAAYALKLQKAGE